jgi:hypothetical protein
VRARVSAFIIPPDLGADLFVMANDVQADGATADRAVFDIFLFGDTAIHQDLDGFSTIGTVYEQGFEWIH